MPCFVGAFLSRPLAVAGCHEGYPAETRCPMQVPIGGVPQGVGYLRTKTIFMYRHDIHNMNHFAMLGRTSI